MSSTKRIKVMLADDHPIMRDGLRDALEGEGEFEVVGSAKDGVEAVRMAQDVVPEVIVMDVMMPNIKGRRGRLPGDHGTAAGHAGADADGLDHRGCGRGGDRRRRDGLSAEGLGAGGADGSDSGGGPGPSAHTGQVHHGGSSR